MTTFPAFLKFGWNTVAVATKMLPINNIWQKKKATCSRNLGHHYCQCYQLCNFRNKSISWNSEIETLSKWGFLFVNEMWWLVRLNFYFGPKIGLVDYTWHHYCAYFLPTSDPHMTRRVKRGQIGFFSFSHYFLSLSTIAYHCTVRRSKS